MDVVMSETELDQLASQCEAASANERETIMREFLMKRRKTRDRRSDGMSFLIPQNRLPLHAGERIGEAKKPGPGGHRTLRCEWASGQRACKSSTSEAGWTDLKSKRAAEPTDGSCSRRASEWLHSSGKRGKPR